ncbi:MAG: (2Fe-2S)-binding protein [Acidobacteria bacterium]|nr:MAG: (2Fe-2S)-binding protein [Acidobacteriota bacterium]
MTRHDAVPLYLGCFVALGLTRDPSTTIETQLIRGFGTCALVLLHLILAIGPLARLDSRFLPLLYNRRHLGVTMFLLALAHGGFALVQFHAQGDVHPLVSALSSHGSLVTQSRFPFELLGLLALLWLFLMAATSHDFWLANLTAPVWKALHMGVYVAYGLVVLHVALGALQDPGQPVLRAGLPIGFAVLATLHLVAGSREVAADREAPQAAGGGGMASRDDGFVAVCRVGEIPEERATLVVLAGERVAVFRYRDVDGRQRIAAVSNVCRHQNGPLGEGRIVDGCITCPWHGYQYRPEDGASPPPFTEKIPTFRVRLDGDLVLVDPRPLAPGTHSEPAIHHDAPAAGPAAVES